MARRGLRLSQASRNSDKGEKSMGTSQLDEQIAGARAYEELHVPALFGQWCDRMLVAARVRPGQRVLDVACGTGILARHALTRVGPSGSVAGVDPGPGMLAVAREKAPDIDWRHGTAESLPFPDDSFDAVVSQFGMMFFTDRSQAVHEMTRVLVPGGRLAVAVWDRLEASEAYAVEVDLLDRMAGPAAADALRAPFVLGDADALAALFESSGADDVRVTTHLGTARFPSVRAMVEADLRGWLPIMRVCLDEETIDNVLAAAEREFAQYVTESGGVVFGSPAHIVTATADAS
jgi:SAM-dependent methyltransferase